MVKRAPISKSSTSGSASAQGPNEMSSGKMTLRVRSRVKMKEASPIDTSETVSKKKKAMKKKKKVSSKIDANKPKKPPTAFFYFLEDFRKGFQEQNPNIKSMRDVGKACGEKWKTMTYEEKVQYYDIATQKRAEFDKAMADYTRRMESGEYEASEEDSEFDG